MIGRSEGHDLAGLGYLGKDMLTEAGQEFTEAVKLNINNIWAKKYLFDLSSK
jgi:hypothetical protein